MEVNVPLTKLLSDKLFLENTPYASFKDFLSAAGFDPKTQEDIEAIPQSVIDAHVAANTKFKDWHELMQAAMEKLFTD